MRTVCRQPSPKRGIRVCILMPIWAVHSHLSQRGGWSLGFPLDHAVSSPRLPSLPLLSFSQAQIFLV